MSWTEFPDPEKVLAELKLLVQRKYELRTAELELEVEQQALAQLHPRNTAVKVVGIDAETKARLFALQQRVIECKRLLDDAEVDVQFSKEQMNIVKSLQYKRGF